MGGDFAKFLMMFEKKYLRLQNADKNYLKIAMPSALEGLFMVLLSSVDIIMVGVLGTEAIAAVSIFTQPRMIILCVARSFGSALALLTADYFGREKKYVVGKILGQSIVPAILIFGALHIFFYCRLENILAWMGAEHSYMQAALAYGNIALAAVFLTSLTTVLQAVLLGLGQTSSVFKANFHGNALNIIGNALFIYGPGPFPALGVVGAAIGTVLGTSCSVAYTIYILRREKLLYTKIILPDRRYFREIAPLFGGVFSEQSFERVGMVIYTRMVAELGTLPYAVHAICMNFCDFYYCFAGGLGKGSMILTGHTCGRGDKEKWQSYVRTGIKWGAVFSCISFGLTFFFREQIFSVYSNDTAAFALGNIIMIFVAAVSFPEAHAMVCAGILRGSGKTTQVAAYSLVSVAVFRPLVTALLLYRLNLGLPGAWLALFIDQSMRALCAHFLIKKIKF